jgi:hypothetical protein
MKNTLRWRQVGYEDRWGTLDKALGRTRTQHTFVVNAPTPAAAAHAAAVILEGHDALEEVPIDTEPGQNKFWAFVTLGTWTNAPSCEVVSVIATKDSLIVNYKPIRHAISMGGAFHHTFLIPLDKLQPGWYTLRLRRLEFGLEDDTRVVRIHIGSIRAFRQEVYKNWLNAQQP